MQTVNAIAKVRFSAARPQRVSVCKGPMRTELVCLEPDQQLGVDSGLWTYYVIKGSLVISGQTQTFDLPAGRVASLDPDEAHTIVNPTEARAICLAVGG